MKRRLAGLTLVEVLIAAILLALGLLPIALLHSTTSREGAMDRSELKATALASELIEEVRAMAEGMIGVPAMLAIPPENPFPELKRWLDVDELVTRAGQGCPLYPGCAALAEASRLYLGPPQAGFHRYLQVLRAPLRLGDQDSRSPRLLEIRVRVDYGQPGVDEAKWRQVVLDTMVSDEDLSADQ